MLYLIMSFCCTKLTYMYHASKAECLRVQYQASKAKLVLNYMPTVIMHGRTQQINLIVCTCDRTTHTFTNMLEYALVAQILSNNHPLRPMLCMGYLLVIQ